MSVRTALLILVAASMMPTFALAEDAAATPLKKGDVIAFLGDSITQQGAGEKGYIKIIQRKLDAEHKDLEIKTNFESIIS